MDMALDGAASKAFLRILDTENEGHRRADDQRFAIPAVARVGTQCEEGGEQPGERLGDSL
jgi:hypothetical protein